MDVNTLSITRKSPLGEELVLLFQRHTAAMHADTPPELIHMMPREALESAGIDFFVLRVAGKPIGMGALKRLDAVQGELKSMHILTEHRGGGHSRRLLDHLIDHARQLGIKRLFLETGVQPSFVAARKLYHRTGFDETGPFAGYRKDPNSVFMTRLV